MAKSNTTSAHAQTTGVDEAAALAAATVADGGIAAAPIAVAVAADATAAERLDQVHHADRVGLVAAGHAVHMDEADEALLEAGAAVGERPQGYILIVSGKAGFRRAGLMHPSRAEYPLDFFTAEQLRLLRNEPRLEFVCVGGEPIPRHGEPHRYRPVRLDPVAAGDAAADAISRPPNRAGAGARNAGHPVQGFVPSGLSGRTV